MAAVHRDSTGALYDHVKVSAPDSEALVTSNILNIPVSDSMDLVYDVSGLLTNVTYKLAGATVGSMTLTYSGQLISNVTVDNLVD